MMFIALEDLVYYSEVMKVSNMKGEPDTPLSIRSMKGALNQKIAFEF